MKLFWAQGRKKNSPKDDVKKLKINELNNNKRRRGKDGILILTSPLNDILNAPLNAKHSGLKGSISFNLLKYREQNPKSAGRH